MSEIDSIAAHFCFITTQRVRPLIICKQSYDVEGHARNSKKWDQPFQDITSISEQYKSMRKRR